MNKIRIMLADDHAIVRAGIQRFIDDQHDIDVVGEATTGEQAYQLFNEIIPDIVLMDLSMPGMSGLEILRRILSRNQQSKVIIYSMHDDPTIATMALTTGAAGYVTKLSETDELVKAIRLVATGKNYISTDMAQKIALHNMSGDNNPLSALTAREYEIFRLLAEGHSVKDISNILSVGVKTVANYQTQIKHKLNIHSSIEFVRLAIKHKVIDDN